MRSGLDTDVNLSLMFQHDVLEEFCSSYRIRSWRTYVTFSDEDARRHGSLHITDQQKPGIQSSEASVKLVPSQCWPPGIYNDKYLKFYEVYNLFSFFIGERTQAISFRVKAFSLLMSVFINIWLRMHEPALHVVYWNISYFHYTT